MTESSRYLWQILEPIHALTYFSKESAQAYEHVGLAGFWRGYFAGRAAPLGSVNAAPVTAAFYGFSHGFVERAVPDVWKLCSPERALVVRREGAASAIRSLAPDLLTGIELERANLLLAPVIAPIQNDRMPLGLANAVLPIPDDPYEQLWHLCTAVREHRGDGHVASLIVAGLDPCEATTLRCAAAAIEIGRLRDLRGWSSSEWDKARDRLVARDLIDVNGNLTITPAGSRVMDQVEATTDRLAHPVTESVADSVAELAALLLPLVARIAESGTIPYPNPIGVALPTSLVPRQN